MVPTISRFSNCSIGNCTMPGVRGMSCCVCDRHLCAQHQSRLLHSCPTDLELSEEDWKNQIKDEIEQLLGQVNKEELVKKASALKNNIGCRFESSDPVGSGAIMGCANYHARLIFDDMDQWLVRIPRRRISDVPDDVVEYLVASEYATLKFLEPTRIPAPRAFGFGLVSDQNNPVGVSYLLIEYLPGKPYQPGMFSLDEQRENSFLEQIAQILIEISKHPLPAAGSLINYHHHIEVSQLASNRFLHLGLTGPFHNTFQYFSQISEQYLDLISDGQVHFQYPAEAFAFYTLAHKEAKMLATDDNVAPGEPPQFFLKHVDDKGDHLLVDDQGTVTGIIDWQFARFAPASEAFGPSYLTANLDWLYSNQAGITECDNQLAKHLRKLGRDDIAIYMEKNEIARRFHHGLGEGVSKEEARQMLEAWLRTLGKAYPSDLDAWIYETCGQDKRWESVVRLASLSQVS